MLSENGIKTKKELEELNQLKRKIKNLNCELTELLELGAMPNKLDCSLPTTKNSPTSPQERYLLKLENLKKKIQDAISETIDKENIFLESIGNLDDLTQNLLMERYLQGKSMKRIIAEFNYCERHIRRLYNEAYETIGEA